MITEFLLNREYFMLYSYPWLLNSIHFADKEKIDCGTVRNPKMSIELEGEASHVYAKNNYSCRATSIGNVFTFDDAMVDCANDVKVKNLRTLGIRLGLLTFLCIWFCGILAIRTWNPIRFTTCFFHLHF